MKTLVVDCTRSKNVNDLVDGIRPFTECYIVRYESVLQDYEPNKSIDAIVISGSGYRSVDPKDREKFRGVMGLIKRFDKPILGVCFAHQLIGYAYGAKLSTMEKPVYDKFEQIRIIETDELFEGYKSQDQIPLVEYHNDYVMKQGLSTAGFILLADSQSCEVEAMKHCLKPLYGIQFHAERYKIGREEHKEGLKILENFYKIVAKKWNRK